MTVLLLGPVPPPQGGVQVNLMAIRDFLRRRGDTCYAINLTRHRRANGDGLFFPSSAVEVVRLIVWLRPDIIHLHVGGPLFMRLLVLGAICAGMPRSRTVFTFHSGGYASSEEGRRLRRGSLKARLLRRFHRLIAVNAEIRDVFLRCGVPAERIQLISPYSSVEPHDGRLPELLEQFIDTHSPFLVTIGLLEPEYDLPLQIDLLGAIRKTHPAAGLLIVGSGSLESELRERIASKPWRDHILLYGDLEHAMTLAALQRADVFLRTTLYDGDALSVREALELRVPVVATKTVLRPAGVRLVDIGDRNGTLAAVLDTLRQNRDHEGAAPAAGDGNVAAVVRLYEEALAH